MKTPPVARRHSAHQSIRRILPFSRPRYFPSVGLAPAKGPYLTLPAASRTRYGASLPLPLHFFNPQGALPRACTLNKTPPRLSYNHPSSGKPRDQPGHGFVVPFPWRPNSPRAGTPSSLPRVCCSGHKVRARGSAPGTCLVMEQRGYRPAVTTTRSEVTPEFRLPSPVQANPRPRGTSTPGVPASGGFPALRRPGPGGGTCTPGRR